MPADMHLHEKLCSPGSFIAVEQIGKYMTWLPDFIAQLRSCGTKPASWNGSSCDVVDTF